MMTRLNWLTAGESHGKGLLGIIEGLPAGILISEESIASELARRQRGHGRGKRMKIEQDRAEIYTGVRHGLSIGAPIGLIIPNADWDNWKHMMSIEPPSRPVKPITLPRPGHGDLAGVKKFGHTDIRNVLERASARETAMRVGLGTICRLFLRALGIEVGSRVVQIHKAVDSNPLPEPIDPRQLNTQADQSPVRCLDQSTGEAMIAAIDHAKDQGDSVGGIFEVIATGLPYGLGSYTQWYRKLRSRISEAIMSINAIEGVEIGVGFDGATRYGSEYHDEITLGDDKIITRPTNRAGGLESGITNGQPIHIRAVMKPIPTLIKPLRSVDLASGEAKPAHKERTDACAVPAASVVAESMLCFVLADGILEKFGGDSLEQVQAHMAATAKY